jgi:hypothetical protein
MTLLRNVMLASVSAAITFFSSSAFSLSADSYCRGVVHVEGEWAAVSDPASPIYWRMGCRFQTSSEVGRKILSTCPDGSLCLITMPGAKRQGRSRIVTEFGQVTKVIEAAPTSIYCDEQTTYEKRKICEAHGGNNKHPQSLPWR